MADNSSAIIQRNLTRKLYEATKKDFLINSKPYESTATLKYTLATTQVQTTGEVPRPRTSALFYIAKAGQELRWFIQGRDMNGILDDDTTLAKGRSTIAQEDFVIEGVSVSHRSTRVLINSSDFTSLYGRASDPDIVDAYSVGQSVLYDPQSLTVPPIVQGPQLLEDAMWEAAKPHIFLEFSWAGSKRSEQLGCLDNVPEGGAKSYLRASGEPATHNRMAVPEGYLWRSQGPDSDFVALGKLARSIIIPVDRGVSESAGPASIPSEIYLDIKLRLHGCAFSFPSKN